MKSRVILSGFLTLVGPSMENNMSKMWLLGARNPAFVVGRVGPRPE